MAFFLRERMYSSAAAPIRAIPLMVKISVPMPPVIGRETFAVLRMVTSAV